MPTLFTYGLIVSLIISLIFITIYVYLIANSSRNISEALNQTRIALFNQKKLSEVGSLSAAAVHELSTPLNTIFLILNDFRKNDILYNNIEIKKEIDLLKSQAERCKEILLRLSKNPQNLKDNFFDKTTISNLVKINFDKFNNRKISLEINLKSNQDEPLILFKDELVYGIGNIIQNAIQHAISKIIINISWNQNEFIINSKWEEMVGDFFNEYSEPIRIENIKSDSKLYEYSEGILHINILSPAALEFQHFNNKIIEKINSFFGYKAISRIVLHHVPYLKKVNKIPKINIHKKKLTLEQKKSIEKVTEGIDSKKLEKALFKLGKSILVDKDQ